MSPPDKPRRPGSSPEFPRTITGAEQPERHAVRHHPGVDGAPQPLPVRSPTLTGMPAPAAPGSVPPPAPAVPLEYAPTKRPPLPWGRTMRAPTPPELLAASRREPPPLPHHGPKMTSNERQGVRVQTPVSGPPVSLPPPSHNPELAMAEALRRRAEAAEARAQEAERQLRVQAEVRSPATFPPSVRHQTPVPSSAPTKTDAAIGKAIRTLAVRLATKLGWSPVLVALGLGSGATAVLKPSADPAKTDATLANTEAIKREQALQRTQLNGVLDREAVRDAFALCLYEQQDEYFSQLMPSQEKLVNPQPLRAWINRCKSRKP